MKKRIYFGYNFITNLFTVSCSLFPHNCSGWKHIHLYFTYLLLCTVRFRIRHCNKVLIFFVFCFKQHLFNKSNVKGTPSLFILSKNIRHNRRYVILLTTLPSQSKRLFTFLVLLWIFLMVFKSLNETHTHTYIYDITVK